MTPSKSVTASAPGKVIICGEHFVVHGATAVAAAISKRARATVSYSDRKKSIIVSGGQTSDVDSDDRVFPSTKAIVRSIFSELGRPSPGVNITITSDIPPGSGLGSSAAVSVATAAALTKFLGGTVDRPKLYETALLGEKQVHGNPSGIDIQASLSGGMILFSRNSGARTVPLNRSLLLLVSFSGRRRRTSELVAKVTERRRQYPKVFDHLTRAASFFSAEAVNCATSGDLMYLGAIMNVMQASLSWIGASNRQMENLIEAVLTGDAYGAKITGAGGGGSIIALPKPERAEALLRSIVSRYEHSFLCTVPQEGLRWEE